MEGGKRGGIVIYWKDKERKYSKTYMCVFVCVCERKRVIGAVGRGFTESAAK
jgi:hypothetical protein